MLNQLGGVVVLGRAPEVARSHDDLLNHPFSVLSSLGQLRLQLHAQLFNRLGLLLLLVLDGGLYLADVGFDLLQRAQLLLLRLLAAVFKLGENLLGLGGSLSLLLLAELQGLAQVVRSLLRELEPLVDELGSQLLSFLKLGLEFLSKSLDLFLFLGLDEILARKSLGKLLIRREDSFGELLSSELLGLFELLLNVLHGGRSRLGVQGLF